MAILLKCGGVFLHVPKSGGNWVSRVLEAEALVFAHLGGKHAARPQLAALDQLLETPRFYGRPNRPTFAFCFVRHPLKWYESWYRMSVALDWPDWPDERDVWNPTVRLNGLRSASFDDFIGRVLDRHAGFLSEMYAGYADTADFVGRQEQLSAHLASVLAFLGIRTEVPSMVAVNVSRRDIDVRLAQALQEDLERAEAAAYERFGYRQRTAADGATDLCLDYSPFSLAVERTPLLPPFTPESGVAWRASLPALTDTANSVHHPYRSRLRLLEDGRPLDGPHAIHDDIRRLGHGRFSHWNADVLFAASDNSDPNRNGRRYEWETVFRAPANATDLMLARPANAPGAQS